MGMSAELGTIQRNNCGDGIRIGLNAGMESLKRQLQGLVEFARREWGQILVSIQFSQDSNCEK